MKFTLATSQGTQQGSFFDLLSAVADGSLLDLPRLRPHQRGPVVTAVAVVMTALRRYAASPPQAAQEWESEWMRQVGPDALRMIAPAGEVAFFQPPLPNDIGHPASDIPLSAVDFTLTRVAHEIKPQRTGTPEQWIYALVSGAWSLSLAKWHGGARQGLTVALPSVGGSIGSEIATLVRAYEGHRPTVVGVNTKPSRAADHFVWMRPHGDTLTVDTLPYPSVEAQPYHLVEESGVLKAVGRHSLPLRIQKEAHLEDPHVPLIAGQPFKLWGERSWSIAFQHALLFGCAEWGQDKKPVTPPSVLRQSGYDAVRICAIGSAQGKTRGYWEALYAAEERQGFSLFSQPQRAAELSARALNAASIGTKALYAAFASVLDSTSAGAATDRLRAALATPLTQAVLDLLAEPPDAALEQGRLAGEVVTHTIRTWREGEQAVPSPLKRARAETLLRGKLRPLTGGSMMTTATALEKRAHAVLADVVSSLTPSDKARLRSMSTATPPMTYWLVLSRVPSEWQDQDALWRVVIPMLGTIGLSGSPVGRALAETGYSEARMSRLLSATGEALAGLIAEALRWLIAHEVGAADIGCLVALYLADDPAAIRRHLAMDFVRTQQRLRAQETAA